MVDVSEDRSFVTAKVCDFGVSRKAEGSDLKADTMQSLCVSPEFLCHYDQNTRATGTSLYNPPEAFNSSAQEVDTPARDI